MKLHYIITCMGASLSWFAIRGKEPEAVLHDFGLRSVGKKYYKTSFCGALLPSGWYLIIHGAHEYSDNEAQKLSRGCEVIACFVEEHVMVSKAAGWKDGRELWSVTYDPQEDEPDLDVRGEPPSGFSTIRDRLTRQQKQDGGADFIFDIPVELAKAITGYRHDETPEFTFENLVKPTFLQRVFGR